MPTPNYNVRIPADVKQAADRKAALLHLTFSDAVNAALREWAGDLDATGTETAAAVQRLQAELSQVRAELAKVTGHEGIPDAEGAGRQSVLADILAAATAGAPATPALLVALTGYQQKHVFSLLRSLVHGGYITKDVPGQYLPVPGMDMTRGVAQAVAAASAYHNEGIAADGTVREPRQSSVPGSRPVPAKPAAAHTARRRPAPGSAVFQPPGEDAVVPYAAPEVPARNRKKGSRS